MKWLAISQGPKIRVNAILPGHLLTEWVCSPLHPSPPTPPRGEHDRILERGSTDEPGVLSIMRRNRGLKVVN